MDNGWEVVFGFVGGGHEVTHVPDEARALAIANLVYTKSGGAAAWLPLHADADGHRIAVCLAGKGPLHTMRIRRVTNGDAAPTPAPEPAPAATPEPTPETPEPPADARH